MMNLENYWWVLVAVGVLVALIVIFTLLRRKPAAPARPQRPDGPLEPARPVIDVARPVAFTAPEPAPAPVAAPGGERPAVAPATGEPDDLRRIKGIGPKLAALLTSLGVTRFDQIAAWTEADIAEVDRFLGGFAGRIARDSWVEQAGYLARGDVEGFQARFGAG